MPLHIFFNIWIKSCISITKDLKFDLPCTYTCIKNILFLTKNYTKWTKISSGLQIMFPVLFPSWIGNHAFYKRNFSCILTKKQLYKFGKSSGWIILVNVALFLPWIFYCATVTHKRSSLCLCDIYHASLCMSTLCPYASMLVLDMA